MRNTTKVVCSLLVLVLAYPYPGCAQLGPRRNIEIYRGQEVVANEVLVKFRAPSAREQVRAAADVDEIEELGIGGAVRLHSATRNTATLIRDLASRPDVVYAEPNFILRAISVPNDPRFGELWGLQNTGQTILGVPGTAGADIGATSAWNVSTGGRSAVIAVIDSGVDYTHPDLAANIWSAPTAFSVNVNGTLINCAAGTNGFNAITNTCDPFDDNNHGTHVSGTIGAAGNNGVGVVGVNWTASIMGSKFLDSTGSGTTANAIKAIEFTIQTKAAFGGATGSANVRVLSNSWGCSGSGCFSQSLLDEINRSGSNDMLFVAAAGNNGTNDDLTPFYPASYRTANEISVAATDNNDGLASFSNYGVNTVQLGAPGVSILSTLPGATYGYFDGTSMATPHVSGTALLLLSRCALTTAQVKTVILNNVDPIQSLVQKTGTTGRLNASKAINSCAFGNDTVMPTSLNFGQHFLGDPPVNKIVTVTNTGTVTINFLGISVGGAPYSVTGGSCGSSLGGGASCTIQVTFTPADAPNGTSNDALTISTNLPASPQLVTLTAKMSCPGGTCL